ncbi:MAG: QueT transporter family protein [Clostridiales bacterium]|jgi:uncharacterized membrane protein|nr:QueT transporter family protein [Clostridiales bacterium]
MQKKARLSISLARIGLIAALYAVLTLVLYPISYGPWQCRVSEVMTLLPLLFWEAVPALIIGCFVANLFSGFVMDIVFGTLATALAALFTYFIGKIIKSKAMPFIAALPPVIFNAFILPLMWKLFTENAGLYWVNFGFVFAGQFVAVYVLGLPVYYVLKSRYKMVLNNKKDN